MNKLYVQRRIIHIVIVNYDIVSRSEDKLNFKQSQSIVTESKEFTGGG